MNLLNRYNRSFSQFLYGKTWNACLKKSSSAYMKNACIDEGDVDGDDKGKVEYDGVY